VKKWLMTEMAPGPNKYGGAEVVLARSFDEERITEDIFLGEALRECGDLKPNWGSPEDRGRRLAGLLRSRRSLLILDGLERIQQPQGANKGNVGPGMAALLTDLAGVNHGLCVVTTRQSIRQLEGWLNGTAREVRLEHLSPDDAIALLDRLGIKGPEAEKREVAIYLRGHCLALELMATYLIDRHDGQVHHWSDDDFTADPEKTDSVRRMLKRYEGWLKPAEREMLRVVSAFDESIGDEEFDVLRRKPVLEGLNTVLAKLGLQSLTEVHHRLTELGLLSGDRVKGHIKYECHPLIRRHFARLFAKQYPDSFKAANLRLFEHYSARPESPDMKLSELQSLLNAVRFGCRAGRRAEAWHNVFWPRIRRNRDGETRNYSLRVLGAFSSDLSALREFFDERWVSVRPGFEPQTEALILMEAGSVLRGLARFKDAQDALQASHEFARDHENASGASEAAGNLAELYVRTGELLKAVKWGQVGLQFADASEDTFLKIVIRGVLANALHATGELDRALAIFSESEALQRDREPDRPILYGIQGWEYWDCLISFRNYREVIQKAQATRRWLTETWKLRNGLTDLAIGLAQLGLVEADGSQALVEAAEHLKRAHRLLTDSQRQEYSPRGILAIARLARAEGNSQEAIEYLMEVLPQVEAKSMKPNLVDTHLELARNYKDLGRESEYLSSLKSAETLIEETGYHVRDPEVAALTRN
jgi:tetratricopeptide (TPR) repeat protein